MYAIDNATAVTSMPAVSPAGAAGFFTGGNPAAGLAATVVTADWLNIVQQELLGAVNGAGITPSKTQLNQLALAVQRLGMVQPFSAALSDAIGGYPLNSLVSDPSIVGVYYTSTVNNNTTPPGSGASWKVIGYGSLAGWTEQNYTLAAGGERTISLNFTAPCAGNIHVIGSANYSAQNTNQTNLTIIVNGQSLSADQVTGATAMTNHSCVAVAAGPVTVASYCGTSSPNPPNVGHTLSYLFVPSSS